MPHHVTDPDDPRLRDFVGLTDVKLRRALEPAGGLYIAEGEKVIRRALAAGHQPRALLMGERWLTDLADVVAEVEAKGVPVHTGSAAVIESITGYNVHRGALASMHRPELPTPEEVLAGIEASGGGGGGDPLRPGPRPRRRVAVLEGLVDHANVGSAFRNAAALGVDAVLVTQNCADPLYRRAIKTSMGNVFNVPWTRTGQMPEALDLLREHGYTTAALTLAEDAITLDDLVRRDPEALALVLGTEGPGVDPRTARQADLRVMIPMMHGVDSLNVAAASAVAFYATR